MTNQPQDARISDNPAEVAQYVRDTPAFVLRGHDRSLLNSMAETLGLVSLDYDAPAALIRALKEAAAGERAAGGAEARPLADFFRWAAGRLGEAHDEHHRIIAGIAEPGSFDAYAGERLVAVQAAVEVYSRVGRWAAASLTAQEVIRELANCLSGWDSKSGGVRGLLAAERSALYTQLLQELLDATAGVSGE